MAQIIIPDIKTTLDLPLDRILESAIGKLINVVIVGYDGDGELYFAASIADQKVVMWLLTQAIKKLLEY